VTSLWHYLDHALVGVTLWKAARTGGAERAGWLALCGAAFTRTADYHHRRP
jgi:hypothetical protein